MWRVITKLVLQCSQLMLSKGVVSKYTSYLYSMSNVSVAVLYSDNIGHPGSISLLLKGCFFFSLKAHYLFRSLHETRGREFNYHWGLVTGLVIVMVSLVSSWNVIVYFLFWSFSSIVVCSLVPDYRWRMTYRKNLVHQKKSVIKPAVHRSLYVPVCTGEQNLGKFRSLRFLPYFTLYNAS